MAEISPGVSEIVGIMPGTEPNRAGHRAKAEPANVADFTRRRGRAMTYEAVVGIKRRAKGDRVGLKIRRKRFGNR